MGLQISDAVRNAQLDALTAQVGNGGKLRIYSGTKPANVAAAITGTMLAEHTLGTPFAPAASGGVLSPNLPANVNAVATGTASHWRVYKSDGTTAVMQGDCATSASDMNLNTTAIVSGGPVQISSWTTTGGGA